MTGVGGSDAPAVLGISPWATPYDLWLSKLGHTTALATSEPMRWGSLLEPVILGEYVRRTRRTVHEKPDMLRHPTHQFMLAHLDGRIVDESRIVEIKTARSASAGASPGPMRSRSSIWCKSTTISWSAGRSLPMSRC